MGDRMEVVKPLLYILVFPGFAFQFVFSTYLEWMDRKFYARMQNRRGPLYTGYNGMLQPLADILKLFFKEDIVPAKADRFMFSFMPILGLAAVVTAGLYLPVWNFTSYLMLRRSPSIPYLMGYDRHSFPFPWEWDA